MPLRKPEASVPEISELLVAVTRRLPYLTSREEELPRQLAAGGLVRATRLLRGLTVMMRAELQDLSGLIVRAAWECWVVGIYLLLEGDDAVKHLGGAFKRDLRLICEGWPAEYEALDHEELPDSLAEVRLNYEQLAATVTKRLSEKPSGIVDASGLYTMLYRTESTFNVHAGYPLFQRYMTGDWPYRAVCNPGSLVDEHTVESMTSLYVAHLAIQVFDAFGIGTREIVQLWPRLLERAQSVGDASV